MRETKNTYFGSIIDTAKSLAEGLKITFGHMLRARKRAELHGINHKDYFSNTEGISTIQYPHEVLPVPDNGRYRLHNEIDDCIVCDKCAKICPVSCIEIEPIKAVEEIGKTSDGTSKRIYAAKFDIDMAKCCFCGLCTTVCPTECLTMTKVYDFSVTDIRDHNFAFAEMSEGEIAEKKLILEQNQKAKAAAAATPPAQVAEPAVQKASNEGSSTPEATPAPKPAAAKPVFKPRVKPPAPPSPPKDE